MDKKALHTAFNPQPQCYVQISAAFCVSVLDPVGSNMSAEKAACCMLLHSTRTGKLHTVCLE